jgi:hypothetical protein
MRYHWGQEYRFAYHDGQYTATSRNGDHATLTAEEPTDLLVQVRRHYKPPVRAISSVPCVGPRPVPFMRAIASLPRFR